MDDAESRPARFPSGERGRAAVAASHGDPVEPLGPTGVKAAGLPQAEAQKFLFRPVSAVVGEPELERTRAECGDR